MEQLFGKSVAELVEGVSNLINSSSAIRKRRRPKTFARDYGDGAGYPRHPHQTCRPYPNMRTLGSLRPDKRRRIAREISKFIARWRTV